MVNQKYNFTYCFLDNVLNSWQQRKLECSLLRDQYMYLFIFPLRNGVLTIDLNYPVIPWQTVTYLLKKFTKLIKEGWNIWSKLNTFDTSVIYNIYNIQEQIKIQLEPAINALPWNGILINMATLQNPWE